MMQYYDLKKWYSDSILFFRMWDFYEMFENDAEIAHKVLWIALTTRNKNAENPIPLAGIPYHAKDKYLPLLIEAWYKVAIAEQVSDPKLKWIVKREVVRVVTPGTIWLEWEQYDGQCSDPVITSLISENDIYAISIINLSDHSWKCSEFTDFESCIWELYKISPSEIILEKKYIDNIKLQEILSKKYKLSIYYYDFIWNPYDFLTKRFAVKNLEWYGLEWKKYAQRASALILKYISENQQSDLPFIQNLSYETFSDCMQLDEATIRSLDLIYNISTGSVSEWTLFWALNETKTPMGKRYLKHQILHPLQDIKEIQQRQKFIAAFKSDSILLSQTREKLKYVADIDAILTRISLERAWPRDLLSLKKSLQAIRDVFQLIEESKNQALKKILP